MSVAIAAANPTLGSASAPVTLIEFSDYQCPFCQRVEPTLKRLRAAYGDKIRIVWKDFPLTQIHPQAFKAGEAAHCAGDQGKYWELHDVLFSNQSELQVDDLKRHALDARAQGRRRSTSASTRRSTASACATGCRRAISSASTPRRPSSSTAGGCRARSPTRCSPPSSTKSSHGSRGRLQAARPLAQTATIYNVTIDLSDLDRGVYETLELRVARHPSETAEYMLVRLLAYCLEYQEGIALTEGVSSGDEPALVVRDLTGRLTAWIEVGLPDAARLHRGSKLAGRAAVYTHRDVRQLLSQLSGAKIHRAGDIPIRAFDRAAIDEVAALIERRASLAVSVSGGERARRDGRTHVHARDDRAPV